MFLECDQTRTRVVTAAEIKMMQAVREALLDAAPDQKYRAPERVELWIRTIVFVHHDVFERQRDDARNRRIAFGYDSNFELLALAFDQVAEPCEGLGRDLVPPSSEQLESVEFAEQLCRSAFLVSQMFTTGSHDLSADTVLVEAVQQILLAAPEINPMHHDAAAFLELRPGLDRALV